MRFYQQHNHFYNISGGKRCGNPYFKDKKAYKLGASKFKNILTHIPPRLWLWFFILIILTIILIWLFFFTNILVIKNIKIEGTNLTPSADIERIVQEQINKKRLLILDQSRLMVFNTNDLKKQILERYALDKINIIKKIPSTLVIKLTEKIPVAVWFEADTYQEIDSSGYILANTLGPIEELPTIYNNGWPRINLPNGQSGNKKIDNAEQEITFVKNLWPEFNNRFPSIKIRQLLIDNEKYTLKLVPEKGSMIYFSTQEKIIPQLDRLDILLLSELKGRFEKLNYIDLRYGDRVYYK